VTIAYHAVLHFLEVLPIQPKLTVGQPGDAYEQEADRIAEQVTNISGSQIQRACDCGDTCSKCRRESDPNGHLQMQSLSVSRVAQAKAPVSVSMHSDNEKIATAENKLETLVNSFPKQVSGSPVSYENTG
jgi:hypothetical protein